VDLVISEKLNIKKLLAKRIDLITMSDESFEGNLKIAGALDRKPDIVNAFTMKKQREFMGFSKGTDSEYIEMFQTAFDKIKADGTLAGIRKKYTNE